MSNISESNQNLPISTSNNPILPFHVIKGIVSTTKKIAIKDSKLYLPQNLPPEFRRPSVLLEERKYRSAGLIILLPTTSLSFPNGQSQNDIRKNGELLDTDFKNMYELYLNLRWHNFIPLDDERIAQMFEPDPNTGKINRRHRNPHYTLVFDYEIPTSNRYDEFDRVRIRF